MLILSSVAAGIIATVIMMMFLYLPMLWNGNYYDVIGALGSARTGVLDGRSRFIGTVIYFLFGIVFAILYGWLALFMLQNSDALPQVSLAAGLPVDVNLIFPLFGLAVGLGHGIIAALIMTVLVIEHHPLERFRTRYILVISQIIGHLVFGFSVMFYHSQFLQLLLGL